MDAWLRECFDSRIIFQLIMNGGFVMEEGDVLNVVIEAVKGRWWDL